MAHDFPELSKATKFGDPWEALVERLMRLALLSRSAEDVRIVRAHRLVQDLIRAGWTDEQTKERQQSVDAHLEARASALENTTRWQDARWELAPFSAQAELEHGRWNIERLAAGWR